MVVGKFRPALLAPASFPAARPRRGSARRRRTAPSGDRPWRELGHFSMSTSANIVPATEFWPIDGSESRRYSSMRPSHWMFAIDSVTRADGLGSWPKIVEKVARAKQALEPQLIRTRGPGLQALRDPTIG